jgi:SWI/SNF-related matrix-associated actin-dependent regulator 1 of chromatin subfamily A
VTTLFPYQLEGARAIHAFGGNAILADEMGLGKSLQVLYYLFKRKKARPAIIVCPANAKYSWANEAARHLNMRAEVLSGEKTPKRGFSNHHAPILIINYEILHCWVDYLIALNPAVVIWDEAHYVANYETIRFEALERLVIEARVKHRIAVSGTPITNRPFDLWPSLKLVAPELYPSPVQFGTEFCEFKIVRGKWQFRGARRLNKLHKLLKKSCMIRRFKKDVQKDLPKKLRKLVPVELSAKDWREYNFADTDFERWMRKRHPGKLHRAMKNPHLTKIGYLLRLTAKLKRFAARSWIDDFFQESDSKLIVFTGHTKMIRWLHKRYHSHAIIIDGSVTGIKRKQVVDRFQNDKRCTLALCNPKAAGVALTMTAANHVLFLDFPYAPGTLKQSEDRIHRIGQKKKCFIWYLAARDTIEEYLCELLMKKQKILDAVLDGKEDSASDLDIFQELFKYATRKKKNRHE